MNHYPAAQTVTRWRRAFPGTTFGATAAHEDFHVLQRTWQGGVLEKQTVTYSAWEPSAPPEQGETNG